MSRNLQQRLQSAGSIWAAFAVVALLAGTAVGQLAGSGEGLANRAVGRLAGLNMNGPGYLYYGVNGADRGLGYIGSYMTLGGFIPLAEDDLGGVWNADLRSHLSVNGGFFSNVGAVRKQLLGGGSLLGFGIFWDYDGDLNQYPTFGEPAAIFGQFGHVYNQVGVSGELLTDWGNLRTNGYIPVGQTGFQLLNDHTPFIQNYIIAQNGLDAALGGADLELGAYVPALADWAGMISVGGYAFGNARYTQNYGPESGEALVPWFGGVYTRLDLTFARNWDFSLQYNNDSFFDSTGFARLTYRMGGSRRRNVPDQMEQPMFRNEHIVRAHETPLVALNSATNQPWQVVHVDNTALPNGNGTVEAPFQTLAEAESSGLVTGNEWTITYLWAGTSSASGGVANNPYTGTFAFQQKNQFLVGSGGPLTLGIVPVSGSNLLTIPSLTATNPVLSNTAGPITSLTLVTPGTGYSPTATVPVNLDLTAPPQGLTTATADATTTALGAVSAVALTARGDGYRVNDLVDLQPTPPLATAGTARVDAVNAASVVIAPDLSDPLNPRHRGGATIANLQILGSGVGLDVSGDLDGTRQPVGTTANMYGSPLSTQGGSAVRNVSILGDGTSEQQRGVRIAGVLNAALTDIEPGTAPTGNIEFSDTRIENTTSVAFQVGVFDRVTTPADPSPILGSGGDANIDYNGSITNNINENGNYSSILLGVLATTGGSVNLAASAAPSGSIVPNGIVDIGGQGILIRANNTPPPVLPTDRTNINIGHTTLVDTSPTAIAVIDDYATTSITAIATPDHPYGITKSVGQATIAVNGGSPDFTFLGTVNNATSPLPNGPIIGLRNIDQATIDIGGPGLAPLLSAAGNVEIIQTTSSNVTIAGLDLRSNGPTGISIDAASNASTFTFKNTSITEATNIGIEILANSSSYDFQDTSISLDNGIGLFADATGSMNFTDLNITMAEGRSIVAGVATTTGDLTVNGNSNLLNNSVTAPAILARSNSVDITFDTVVSGVDNATGTAANFNGTLGGTFTASAFTVGGLPGSDGAPNVLNSVTDGGTVTVNVPGP